MIVVAPVGAHLVHPGLAPGGLAQGLLDRGVDEDALDFGLLGRRLDDRRLSGRPMLPVDREPVLGHHVDRRHVLALLERERMVGHRGEPDVGVEADLMRGVAGQHRPAARLGESPTRMPFQTPSAFALREKRSRKAIIAGFPHMRLRDRRTICQETRRRRAAPWRRQDNRASRSRSTGPELDWRQRPSEDFLGGEPGIGGIGERGQGSGSVVPLSWAKDGRAAGEGANRQNRNEQLRSHDFHSWAGRSGARARAAKRKTSQLSRL